MRRQDWLVSQLPVGMLDDPFLVRFVRIFQDVADTVATQVDNRPYLLDPAVAPLPMVRLMGAWIGLHVDSSLPEPLQRTMVRTYSECLPWLGTAHGLHRVLTAFTGGGAHIDDSGGVFRKGQAPGHPPHVKIAVDTTGKFTDADLLRFVRAELPASVTFELRVGGRQVWPLASERAGVGAATAEGHR